MTTPTRILLIDDDPADRAAVATALAGSTLIYTLDEATDAATGIDAAAAAHFDCVLLDSQLAGVTATDFVTRLASPEGGRQAVIALIDGAEHATVPTLLRAGALDSLGRREADSHNLARAIRYATARRGFVIELQAARDDAEAHSRALDRLNRHTTLILSILAHDLRNPFQILLGMSQLLVDTAAQATPGKIAGRAASVLEAANQAYGLMESLFSWASLHMDARAEPVRIDVDALLGGCARALQEAADAKGVRIETRATQAFVFAQQNAAEAILRNFIANAVKFTPTGGCVTVTAELRDSSVALIVADTGVGMSEAQAASLFQFENRSTSAGTAGERGAGLGLLLCRHLAEWISGELEVESQLGHGAAFRLLLPAAEG